MITRLAVLAAFTSSLAVFAFADDVKANVAPYTVSPGFKEVTNYAKFKKQVKLSPEHEKLLQKNLFVVSPTDDKQLYWIYGRNDYTNMSSFVTVDTVLNLYHVFFDSTLRKAEEKTFYPVAAKLTSGMLKLALADLEKVTDPEMKGAALKNAAYFAVAAKLLDLKVSTPSDVSVLAKKDLDLITGSAGFAKGGVFPYDIDYSRFIVRGHYTRNEKLGRYFKALTWYGLTPFSSEIRTKAGISASKPTILQSILLTKELMGSELKNEWEKLYEPTSFYVGTSNSTTPAEWMTAIVKAYGASGNPDQYSNATKYGEFLAEADKLRKARIKSARTSGTNPGTAIAMRFMGMRYIPDSEITQRLSRDERPMVTGLDVMGVFGSARARAIVDANPTKYNPKPWGGYEAERAKLMAEFDEIPEVTWNSNLYWSWFYCLKALLDPAPAGYPSFMQSKAWQDKSLSSALGSWAELRHDTILYGEQSASEMGDGDEPPFVKHYVEPNPTLYSRLAYAVRQTRDGLSKRGLLPEGTEEKFKDFLDLLEFLRSASVRELTGGKLSREEHDRIRKIEGMLEYLSTSMIVDSDQFNQLSEEDKDMALIADVHTGYNKALEVGVGRADNIFVIVPIEGKLTIARGAVYSFYEFTEPIANRLTDKKWRQRLDSNAPARPEWTKSFHVAKKVVDK